jgi:hypothetical protein
MSLTMKAVRTSETSVHFNETTRCYIQKAVISPRYTCPQEQILYFADIEWHTKRLLPFLQELSSLHFLMSPVKCIFQLFRLTLVSSK